MFCLNYYPSQSYLQDADELKIKYRPADRTLEDFLKTYQDKSIVIDVSDSFDEIDAKLFKGLYEKYKNFKLIVDYSNQEYVNRVKEYNLPFFFSNFASTIDQVNGFLTYHPTDMYICEELGFWLNKVSDLLHSYNVRVRVFPNICQSSFPETPSIKTFFIRPEDVETYSNFVDVFELVSDEARQKVLFKVYKQGKWFGKIDEIIPSFKGDLDSRYILSNFGIIRSKCRKRCMYDHNSCNVCGKFVGLAEVLEKKKIIIKEVKKKS